MTPLAGIKVVEAAAFISGPFATMILADLGAEVIKVEPPRGEPYRRLGNLYGTSSLVFRGCNQNKAGIALDLKSSDGFARLQHLLADADIFLTNWRPGVAESMGLTADAVREAFPNLIWVRVSGYGQTGPKAKNPAYDGVIHAESGAMLSGRGDGRRPVVMNSNVADKVTAMTAAQTATAALLERARTGRGMICDVAMLDANAYFYSDISPGYRIPEHPVDPYPGVSAAGRTTFATGDGWITVVPVTGRQLRGVLAAIGESHRWDRMKEAGSEAIWPQMLELVEPALLTESAEVWAERFTAEDVPCTAVKDFSGHIADPQVLHNRTYVAVDDPGTGTFMQVRYPAIFDGQPVAIDRRSAPDLKPPG